MVRTKSVMVGDNSFVVQEASAVSFSEYGRIVKQDKVRATAILLTECVLDEDGLPALTMDSALIIARSARVTMPLVQAIMELSGFGSSEKESVAS